MSLAYYFEVMRRRPAYRPGGAVAALVEDLAADPTPEHALRFAAELGALARHGAVAPGISRVIAASTAALHGAYPATAELLYDQALEPPSSAAAPATPAAPSAAA